MRSLPLHTTEAVVSEIMAGGGRSCAAAAKLFPAHRGDRVTLDPSTVWRWMARGLTLPDGRVLRLEAARVVGRILTSDQAVRRFIEAQVISLVEVQAPAHRSPTKREQAAEQAAKQLEQIGV